MAGNAAMSCFFRLRRIVSSSKPTMAETGTGDLTSAPQIPLAQDQVRDGA